MNSCKLGDKDLDTLEDCIDVAESSKNKGPESLRVWNHSKGILIALRMMLPKGTREDEWVLEIRKVRVAN